jgi:excisionase family DNA binding protein
MTGDAEKSFLTVKEAAYRLDVPPSTVYGWIRKNNFPDLKFKKIGGKLIIAKPDVDKVLNKLKE